MTYAPVTTIEELDLLDDADLMQGYLSAERGDPEPGGNHSRSFHHGWRMRMMDLSEIDVPAKHRALVRAWVQRCRLVKPRGGENA
jgi:hypothetical protein